LVGNIPTERVIETLKQRGAELPALKPLDSLLKATAVLREIQQFARGGLRKDAGVTVTLCHAERSGKIAKRFSAESKHPCQLHE